MELCWLLLSARRGKKKVENEKMQSIGMISNYEASPEGITAIDIQKPLCVADAQLKGRGARVMCGNHQRGVAFCFLFSEQMKDDRVVPHLHYVVCLAMIEAIKVITTVFSLIFVSYIFSI